MQAYVINTIVVIEKKFDFTFLSNRFTKTIPAFFFYPFQE